MEARKKFRNAVLKIILRNRDKAANEKPKIHLLVKNIKEQLAKEEDFSEEENTTSIWKKNLGKKAFSKKLVGKNIIQKFFKF